MLHGLLMVTLNIAVHLHRQLDVNARTHVLMPRSCQPALRIVVEIAQSLLIIPSQHMDYIRPTLTLAYIVPPLPLV